VKVKISVTGVGIDQTSDAEQEFFCLHRANLLLD
jgi:hypothetical protein